MPGLTPSESAIMDLWDSGLSIARIATALRMPRGRVQRGVSNFDGADDARRHRKSMRQASARLLRAIQRERGM